jgi:putative peptidoglycan lipid II flippase
MLTVAVMTVLVKLIAAAKEVVVAGYFGTGDVVDAFLIAFLLPTFAINLLAGSFSSAMMPAYIRLKDNASAETARQLFSSILVLALLFLVSAAFVLAILAPTILPLLGSGFSAQTMALALSLFYWLLPVLVFSGACKIYAVAINAEERFILVALVPAITPICSVVLLVLFAEQLNIYALAAGLLVGSVAEVSILASVAAGRGLPVLPRWFGLNDDLRSVIRQYVPMVTAAFLMSGTVLVDQAMAAMLESGSVATLNYANKVVAMVLSVGSIALGTAVFPHFSRMVAKEDWGAVRHTFSTYTRLILLISVPITVVLFLFSESIIGILFERGAFSAKDTRLVGQAQAFYLLQIPFYVLGIMGVRLLSAVAKNQILMKISFVNLLTNIVANYIFMLYFGVAGIAMSTAMVYALSFGLIYFSLFRRNSVLTGDYGG